MAGLRFGADAGSHEIGREELPFGDVSKRRERQLTVIQRGVRHGAEQASPT
jgi:hypothetical protein